MALELIGAGLGRTGTLSLKAALERIGYGPCYHMIEVLAAPERGRHWLEQAQSGSHDWDAIFNGYRATVDWPAAAFWRELAERYPDAKVLLSLRDADRWYDSVMNTIYPLMTQGPPERARCRHRCDSGIETAPLPAGRRLGSHLPLPQRARAGRGLPAPKRHGVVPCSHGAPRARASSLTREAS